MTLIVLALLVLLAPVASAEDVVRYSGSTYLGCQSLGDTTVWLTNPNDYSTVKPGYLYVPTGCASVLPGVPDRYRTMSGTTVVEMTPAEQDAVDAPAVAAAALQATYDSEIASNDLCDATLAQVVSRIDSEKTTLDTGITGITNIASAKTVLLDLNSRYALALKKLATCLRARAR